MLINLRNALMAGKHTPTAQDYVQSGLVAMFDGIENAGWGVHDENATKWRELVTGVDYDVAGTWDGNVFVPATTDLNSAFIQNVIAYLPRTIEFCSDNTDVLTNNQYNGFYFYGSDRIYSRGRGTRTQISFISSDAGLSTVMYSGPKGGTLSLVSNLNEATGFINGASAVSGEIIGKTVEASLYWYGNSRINCLRIYSRALTASEIARNYAIDKARFGLP